MSLATTHCRAAAGIDAPLVTVEVHLANGLPAFHIVGLPEKAVQESRDRVRGALVNSGFEFPARRITVNLAPADLPKDGGRFDLAIAVGILAASAQVPDGPLSATELMGELALSGALRPITGTLPAALAAHHAGHAVVLPVENADEAGLIRGALVHPATDLLAVAAHLIGQTPLALAGATACPDSNEHATDLADVRGQPQARRALEVAAAGAHHLLMSGPPGTGKSMLASRLPGILPPLSDDEALETAAVLSISGRPFNPARWRTRPYRAPHHTASGVALVGGGGNPRPGEISLAHHGVLFLDELPEFDRKVLEVLREPLENGHIVISRAARQAQFPARFQLVAAMNPCPCGHLGDTRHACRCTADQVSRYRGRVSGPLLDRIDVQITVPPLPADALTSDGTPGECSARVRERVSQARQRQMERQGCTNADLSGAALDRHCALDEACHHLLRQAMQRLGLSARGYHRVLRVARTIADLDDAKTIAAPHLTEAIGYRRLDSTQPR